MDTEECPGDLRELPSKDNYQSFRCKFEINLSSSPDQKSWVALIKRKNHRVDFAIQDNRVKMK